MKRFYPGDRVRIAKDLGTSMNHFPGKGEEAIIIHSDHRNKDRFGSGSQYALHLQDGSYHAWYYWWQLTLVERSPVDFHKVWKYILKKFDESIQR